jgi:TusA-related sulfurtransferase
VIKGSVNMSNSALCEIYFILDMDKSASGVFIRILCQCNSAMQSIKKFIKKMSEGQVSHIFRILSIRRTCMLTDKKPKSQC